MKNKLWVKIIVCLLVVCTLASLVSCKKDDEAENSDGNDTAVTTQADEGEIDYDPHIEAKDYGGREFIIFSRENTGGTDYEEFDVKEYSSNLLNSAVYDRNMYLQEKYNIEIVVNTENKDSMGGTVKRLCLAETVDFDLINATQDHIINMAMNGCLMQTSDIPYINPEKPYWSAETMEAATIVNKGYLLCGDANLWSLHAVGGVIFNTQMIADKKLDNPYDLVKSGKWTYEKFTKMTVEAAEELNGDGIYDERDCYGCVSTYAACETMFSGMNGILVIKDSNDEFVMNYTDDKTLDIVEKIVEFWKYNDTLLINRFPNYTSPKAGSNMMADVFNKGNALFIAELMYQLPTLIDNNFTIGLVPAPKYNEDQTEYKSFVHVQHATALGVPALCSDADMVGRVLEDMAYKSMSTVRYSYYEVNLKSRRAQDDDSIEMLDIMYAGAHPDTGYLYSGGGLTVRQTIRDLVFYRGSNITSEITKSSNTDKAQIDKLVNDYFAS